MADQDRKRMPLRTRILIIANVVVIGLFAFLYAPHPGFMSLRNQIGVWAFNRGMDPPARLMFEVLSGQGHVPATSNYGAMVFQGLGDSWIHRSAAMRLITEAAHAGYAPAQYNLGRALQLGRGIEKDETQARQWFERAAAQDDLFALMMVADALEGYQELGSTERMQEVLERAAAQGEPQPLFSLAWHTHMTCDDRHVVYDCREREIGYLRQAADLGHVPSQAELGSELIRGIDAVEGFQWLLKAAEAGHYRAMRLTARSYRNGSGVQADMEQADYWADRYENFPREPSRFIMPRGYDAIYIYRYRRRAEHARPRATESASRSSDECLAGASINQGSQAFSLETWDALDERYMRELRETATAMAQRHPSFVDGIEPASVRDVHVVRVSDGRTGPLLPASTSYGYEVYRCQRDAQRSTVVLRYAGDPDAVLILLSVYPVDWRIEVPGAGPTAVLLSAGWQVPLIDGLSPTVPLAIDIRGSGALAFDPPRSEQDWVRLEGKIRERFPNARVHRYHHVRTTLVDVR